jgi:hypothetical protein
MKRFLMVLMVLLVGVSFLSAETLKGKYYEDGFKCVYTLSHYPIEDKFGVFSISEAQELLESLGWDDCAVLKDNASYFNDLENEIFETLPDEVEWPEDTNLIEMKMTKDGKTTQMYIFTVDWIYSSFNKRGYIDTLAFVRWL